MRLLVTLLAALLFPALALANPAMPSAPALASTSYVLYDFTSNQVLVNQNGGEHIAPGSLNKLMTAYLTLSAVEHHVFTLKQTIYPSIEAINPRDNEPRMFLDHNKAVTVDELLHGLIIESGNDAARVLAELISGNEPAFAELMNQTAQRLGMKDSRFVNATGQPHPQQYTSAFDLMLLAAAVVREFPDYYPIYGIREYQYNKIKQFNPNRLLWSDPYVDGMKTGHAEGAGFGLVASAKRDGRRLISVVLGTASENLRITESQKLLNFGFQYFEAVPLYQKNQPVASLRLWKGTEPAIKIGFPQGLSVTVPKGSLPQFKAALETYQPILAPVGAGQHLGVLKLSLDGKPYAEFPVVALEGIPLANVFARGLDSLRLQFYRATP